MFRATLSTLQYYRIKVAHLYFELCKTIKFDMLIVIKH